MRERKIKKEGNGVERERKKNEKKKVFRFSLRSTKIGSSIFVGARGKVHLRYESFIWV